MDGLARWTLRLDRSSAGAEPDLGDCRAAFVTPRLPVHATESSGVSAHGVLHSSSQRQAGRVEGGGVSWPAAVVPSIPFRIQSFDERCMLLRLHRVASGG